MRDCGEVSCGFLWHLHSFCLSMSKSIDYSFVSVCSRGFRSISYEKKKYPCNLHASSDFNPLYPLFVWFSDNIVCLFNARSHPTMSFHASISGRMKNECKQPNVSRTTLEGSLSIAGTSLVDFSRLFFVSQLFNKQEVPFLRRVWLEEHFKTNNLQLLCLEANSTADYWRNWLKSEFPRLRNCLAPTRKTERSECNFRSEP